MVPVTFDKAPVGICVSTGELTRFAAFNQSLAMLNVPNESSLIWTCGPLIAANMNRNFQSFLENEKLQWAWIIGDDHTFPNDIVLKLLEHNLDVVVPLCTNREPPCAFTIIDESNNKHRDFDKVPMSGLFKLEGYEVCGDAGMLLSRKAVEALGPPWYENLVSGTYISEDRYFARKIKERGMDIWIDADVQLGHITPCIIQPIASDGVWNVLFSVGSKPLAQFRPTRETPCPPSA